MPIYAGLDVEGTMLRRKVLSIDLMLSPHGRVAMGQDRLVVAAAGISCVRRAD